MTDAEREAFFAQSLAAHRALNEAALNATSWQEADAAIRPLLDDYPAVPAYEIRQIAATLMMHRHLQSELANPSPESHEAIGRYTDMMVENGSGDAVMVSAALTSLDGYWPGSKLSTAAAQTARAAKRTIAKQAGCADCQLDARLAALEQQLPSGATPVPGQIAQAIRDLEARAE